MLCGLAAHLSQVLHGKQFGLIDVIGHLALELQRCTVVGLDVDDAAKSSSATPLPSFTGK